MEYPALSDLFNVQMWAASLEYLSRGWSGRTRESEKIILLEELPYNQAAYRWDGNYVRKPVKSERLEPKGVTKRAIRQANTMDLHHLDHWAADRDGIALFEQLLRETRQSRTNVMLVLPPFHPGAWTVLSNRQSAAECLSSFVQIVYSFLQENPDLTICNALNPETPGCGEDGFWDACHMLPPCAKRVVEHCFRSSKDWADMLAPRPAVDSQSLN